MYRRNINKKTKCGQQTGKALSSHESFSPSQSHETVPFRANIVVVDKLMMKDAPAKTGFPVFK
jgi:hypothetical protein